MTPAQPWMMRDETIAAMLESLAGKSPTPGGGAVAALLSALGAATAHMTLNYSIGRKSLAQHADLHERTASRLEALRDKALTAADEDAEAYAALNTLWKLPADDPTRQREFPEAVRRATEVPLSVLRDAVELLALIEQLCGATNDMLNSDLAIAAICAEAAGRAAAWNVRINLPSIDDRKLASSLAAEMNDLLDAASQHHRAVTSHCESVASASAT